MKSICPKCKKSLGPHAICCADVRYTWRCRKCFKLAAGFALPYGKCQACRGELQMIPCGDPADSLHLHAIRQALQLELDSFHFFKLARDQARDWDSERCSKSFTKPRRDSISARSEVSHPFKPAGGGTPSGRAESDGAPTIPGHLPQRAFGRRGNRQRGTRDGAPRTRDQLRKLEATLPSGGGQQLCKELASEEEAHVAIFESELAQIGAAVSQGGHACQRSKIEGRAWPCPTF
jgi:hypothetical protein